MENRNRYIIPRNLSKRCPIITKGDGIYLYDADGKRYIDGASGSSLVCNIGHGVKEVTDVMSAQTMEIAYNPTHCSISKEIIDLSEKLASLAPGQLNKIFTVCGGSEATETAMKFVRQYQVEKGDISKHEIISRWQSYHGNTNFALSVSGHTGRRRVHAPILRNFPHIPPAFCYRCYFRLTYPNCDLRCARVLENAILQEGPENVSAFIAEPVVGAALGAVPAPDGYFQIIREICDKYEVIFIADEVMTGFGRTGKWFAVEHWEVIPDVIATGKGLAGGYIPLGAAIMASPIPKLLEEKKVSFIGGHTYSGHLLSAKVGSTVLDYIKKNKLIENCRIQGEYLMEGLRNLLDIEIVGDVRGKGLMTGIEFVKDKKTKEPFPVELHIAEQVMNVAMEKGLIIFPGHGTANGAIGDHLLVGPPLTIDKGEINEMLSILKEAIETVKDDIHF